MDKTGQSAEQALWESGERYRVLFDSIDAGFCVIEMLFDDQGEPTDYRFLEINPAFVKQTGLREAVGKRMRDLEPRHEQHWFDTYGRIALTGEPRRFVQEAKYLDDRWYEVYAFRVGQPEERKVAVLFTDISGRKRVEQALRDSEQRFRALVTASSEVVYRMSPDWSEMRALDGQGFMVDTEETRKRWLEEYIHPDDQPLVLHTIQEAIRSKGIFELEHPVRRIDGTLGWMLSRAVPMLDDKGEISEWFGAASDVTERKEAADALREAARAKDEFLAVLGHELRNPLAPMSMVLELLQRARTRPELIDRIGPMMKRQLDHLTRLVDDLLDVSRLARGRVELQRASLDLRDAVEAAVEQCKPLIDERRHALNVEVAEGPVPVFGDFQRLSQVIGNLLTNAAKYSESGSSISLRCGRQDKEAVVQVSDTGYGVPAERLGGLFEMFHQVPEHRARVGGGGLGIGLALSRQLIELHGGWITAASEGLGRGSEFVVRMPLAATAHRDDAEAQRREHDAVPSCRRRVLVVDDNVDAADGLCMVLKAQGQDVKAVYDGAAALDLMESFAPDVVLLDIGLPRMDGLEVARQIRANPGGESVTLVALTGWGQEEDKQRTREAGFDEHLTKPVDMGLLSTLVSR